MSRRKLVRKAAKKTPLRTVPPPASAAPGMTVDGGAGIAELRGPEGMDQTEIEYRMLLQEAIFHVTKQVLVEQKPDILRRAEERARTLMELRK